MLKINNLTKTFGGLKAVDNVTAEFRPGKITSLIGPNGAGKTTLFNLISGFLKPDEGEILLEVRGQKQEDRNAESEARSQKSEVISKRQDDRSKMQGARIDRMTPYEIAKLGIGRLFQDVRVFKKMNCIDNIVTGRRIFGENPLEALFLRKKVKRDEEIFIKKAEEILEFVGLKQKERVFAEDLSYGQQKLLSIARLLYGDFDILLLDEPTAGVNPAMIEKILEVIKNLAKMGKTIIIIEHNMNVVYRISDWVYFMNEGAIVAFGFPDEVLGNEEVRRIYIGL